METTGNRARLIIVCKLPGSGKTTLASTLESKRRAARFSPDQWIDALPLDLWEEAQRARIVALQWKLAQRLLALGLTVNHRMGHLAKSRARHLAARGASPGCCR